MKINLSDVTFIIPVRIDSVVRLENLLLTIKNLESNFVTHIEIIEASSYNNGLIKSLLSKDICYRFIEDKDPIFHRTKYINWRKTRLQLSPCDKCIYCFICPPPSNYEIVVGKNNLCNLYDL